MDKNQKSVLFVSLIGVMVILMLILYMNFLHDKPLIEKQNQQPNLSPDQMVQGVKKFINDTTSTMKMPPIKP